MNQIAIPNMIIDRYAVSIKQYETTNGIQISVDFKDMPGALNKTGHISIRKDGERLLFHPVPCETGRCLRKNGENVLRISISDKQVVEELEAFTGVYDTLHYDKEASCWYVSEKESRPAYVVNGLRLGNSIRSTKRKNRHKKAILEELALWISDALLEEDKPGVSILTKVFNEISIL